ARSWWARGGLPHVLCDAPPVASARRPLYGRRHDGLRPAHRPAPLPGDSVAIAKRHAMAKARELHDAARRGDTPSMRTLLDGDGGLANSVSATDARGTYPLHVAAEFGQASAARLLIAYGADVSRRDAENDAIPLGWAAFFGRPEVVVVLLQAGSDP